MKRSYKLLILAILALPLTGCKDFLERTSQELVIPEATEQYMELLRGDGYFQNVCYKYNFIDKMTDNYEFFDARAASGEPEIGVGEDTGVFSSYGPSYLWQRELESEYFTEENYLYQYSQILIANICLENVDSSVGTDEEKEILRGSAAFHRALGYFNLANVYAQAYNESEPGDLCVPLKLDSEPQMGGYPRATMKDVWGQMTTDIKVALDNLKDKDITNLYEIKYGAALVLAVRIALFMENWDDVIKYGEEFIELGTYPLYDISSMTYSVTKPTSTSRDATVVNFMNTGNTELTWVFGAQEMGKTYYNYASGAGDTSYYLAISALEKGNLMSLYDWKDATQEGDRRRSYWFSVSKKISLLSLYTPLIYSDFLMKWDDKDANSTFGHFAIRTAEVYLSLAEAYARKPSPDNTKALKYLNELRAKRIKPYTDMTMADFPVKTYWKDPATGVVSEDRKLSLTDFIWDERRRELCFEELHRWWDLRRIGQPSIRHRWRNGVQYELAEKDPAYVLNFPEAEMIIGGSELVPNERPERVEVTNPDPVPEYDRSNIY